MTIVFERKSSQESEVVHNVVSVVRKVAIVNVVEPFVRIVNKVDRNNILEAGLIKVEFIVAHESLVTIILTVAR